MTDTSHIKVGDRLWLAQWTEHKQEPVPCPVCFGKCEVVLILGNDDRVTLPCDYCARGFEEPRGYVLESGPLATAKLTTITEVIMREDADGVRREYRSRISDCSCLVPHAEDLFATQEEALARAEEKATAERERREKSAEWLKANTSKSFAWNAGYHLRCAKTSRKDAEYHDRKAVLCKARAVGHD